MSKNQITITREFNAPVQKVWKAWTDPKEQMRWYGPKTFTCPQSLIDFKVGGKYFLCMRSPEGKNFFSTGIYKEIVNFEKIVCTDSFADEHGNVVSSSYYGMPDMPMELLITLTFEEIESNKTKMTLCHEGFADGSENKRLATIGWNESLDKLEAIL